MYRLRVRAETKASRDLWSQRYNAIEDFQAGGTQALEVYRISTYSIQVTKQAI